MAIGLDRKRTLTGQPRRVAQQKPQLGLVGDACAARCAYSTASPCSPRFRANSAARASRAFSMLDPKPNPWPEAGAGLLSGLVVRFCLRSYPERENPRL